MSSRRASRPSVGASSAPRDPSATPDASRERAEAGPRRPLVWPRRPPRASFQPRATLGLVYTAVFTIFWALVLIAPTLWHVMQTVPPGPELQRAAHEAAREAARPRLLLALALALVTVALGARSRVLPGIRR